MAVTAPRPRRPPVTATLGEVIRRPRRSTASTLSAWRPAGISVSSRSSAYGAVVSVPIGRPFTRKVTATIRAFAPRTDARRVTVPAWRRGARTTAARAARPVPWVAEVGIGATSASAG